ncbi:MAG: hypothetical protein CVV05_00765 [Gammaproteobacteria bacterium HGW-Gammaproteobacteria-1]|jgi:Arc/MetJ-type ribon-helix-helix transcriptional regulator|nr:MAG: hypothetical protein CVV05_00765 [Gammaproteobacteria bacterium HGW-Gammaproteobacteria-1]
MMLRTTLRLPEKLRDALTEHLKAADGYGVRDKSRWIGEAIHILVTEDKMLGFVGVGSRMDPDGNEVVSKVELNDEAADDLKTAIRKLRRQSPLMEGVQSEVIRSAIRYRLRRDANCHRVAEEEKQA